MPLTPRPWTPADVVATVVALAIGALGAGAALVLAAWLVLTLGPGLFR